LAPSVPGLPSQHRSVVAGGLRKESKKQEESQMKTKRITMISACVIMALVAAFGGCGPASRAAALKPERVVENFYDWYLDYPGNAIVDGAYRSSEYLAEVYVQKADDIIASFDKGGYDPFLCAQDVPGDLTVDQATVSGNTTTVTVHEIWNPITQYENSTSFTVTLVKTEGQWKITDIVCPVSWGTEATPLGGFLDELSTDVAGAIRAIAREAMAPQEVVEAFYASISLANPLADGSYRWSPYLTHGFVEKVDELIASFDEGGYDPFLCAQDIPGRMTTEQPVISGDGASVIVRQFWNPGTQYESITELTVLLQKVNRQWKIDDVFCATPDPLAPVIELPQATSPEGAVQGFYDWYLRNSAYVEHTGERLNPLVDGRYRSSPYLTEGLVQKVDAIVAAFDKGGFDPFLCAQDVPESYSLDGPVVSGDAGRVVVRTSFEGHAFTVALLRESGGWKISDVLCEVDDSEETTFEGWQTFSDDGYGFQLRYPPNWTFEELKLWPPEATPDAEKALKRAIVFQPQGWDGVAPPLHVQVTQGTIEEYALLHVPPTTAEELTINGNRVAKEVEDLGSGWAVTRYVYTSPNDENIRIVLLDYISGFPERSTGNEEVVNLCQQMLLTLEFAR
jgi:hypothetical protein